MLVENKIFSHSSNLNPQDLLYWDCLVNGLDGCVQITIHCAAMLLSRLACSRGWLKANRYIRITCRWWYEMILVYWSLYRCRYCVDLRKLTRNNPSVDLVNAYAKFGEIPFICSQNFERKWAETKFWQQSRAIILLLICENWRVTIPT